MAAAYSLLSVPQQPGTEANGETFAQIVMQGRANRQKAEEDDTPADWRVVALTSSPGTSKTQILTDALNAWLERKGAQELDQRFGPRLDRQSRTTERLERKVDALTEMLGLFIRHQLTLVADQPPFDSDTARLGKTRYLRFMELVERRLMRADSGEATALAKQEEQP